MPKVSQLDDYATDEASIINKTRAFVFEKLCSESSGHDWWHVYRVWKVAKQLGLHEKADIFVVELAALLHDIADWKFHNGNNNVGSKVARDWLEKLGVDEHTIAHVCKIIKDLSFKGASVESRMETIEGMVVQDADRLDAIGALGIARTFAYGGHRNREIFNPDIAPRAHQSFDEYKSNRSPTINHFYEKLLLLKDRMNTKSARQMAEARHAFMEDYLQRFHGEWEGKI